MHLSLSRSRPNYPRKQRISTFPTTSFRVRVTKRTLSNTVQVVSRSITYKLTTEIENVDSINLISKLTLLTRKKSQISTNKLCKPINSNLTALEISSAPSSGRRRLYF